MIVDLNMTHVKALAELHRLCFPTQPWSQSLFADYFENKIWSGLFGFGLCKKEELFGFLLARTIEGETEIYDFAISPDFQRQGYGQRLLKHLLDQTKGPIFLEVSVMNMAAIHLYQKYGFKITARRKNYYRLSSSHFEDAFVMTYNVSSNILESSYA